jgi:hypothetical protein
MLHRGFGRLALLAKMCVRLYPSTLAPQAQACYGHKRGQEHTYMHLRGCSSAGAAEPWLNSGSTCLSV